VDKAVAIRIRNFLLAIFSISLVISFLLFLGANLLPTPNRHELVQLNDGWTISRGENTQTPDDISKSNIGVVDRGEVIILKRILPDSGPSPAALYFKSVLSKVEVSIDHVGIYKFGEAHYDKGLMVPKMFHFVPLPDDYHGREIQIVLTPSEENAFSGLTPFWLGDYTDIYNMITQSNLLPMVIGVYLIVLGFLLLILSPFLIFSIKRDYSICMAAFTSWMLGSYILCYNGIFWLFSDNPDFYTFIEYFSLYMAPPMVLGFILATRQSPFKIIGNILFLISLFFALGTSFIHLLGFAHICNFVWILHVLTIIEALFIIFSLLISSVKAILAGNKIPVSTSVLIIGLILISICAIIDIIKYNWAKFSLVGEVNSDIYFVTIGALLFMMCLLLNYFYYCIEYISESSIKQHLEGLAYSDPLTGLQNRAKCETVLAEISGEYTIISFDLDYLKYTNDNYGHVQGDALLKGFGDILRNTFTDATLVGRMGGDEFVVILPYVDEERAKRDFDNLTDQMDYRNSQETRLKFSASWGYASNKDKELTANPSAQAVYLLADQRMYAMKSRHHKESLGRLYDDLIGKLLEKEELNESK
jgi:diguanylate cyclase (GGDEF)-like protein